MAYRRPRGYAYRNKRRANRASSTIGRAWRRRKARRSGGLVARTAVANRRNIRRINRSIETKMIELPTATPANAWAGQNLVRIQVDSNGFDSVSLSPCVLKPFSELAQGDTAAQRTGIVNSQHEESLLMLAAYYRLAAIYPSQQKLHPPVYF